MNPYANEQMLNMFPAVKGVTEAKTASGQPCKVEYCSVDPTRRAGEAGVVSRLTQEIRNHRTGQTEMADVIEILYPDANNCAQIVIGKESHQVDIIYYFPDKTKGILDSGKIQVSLDQEGKPDFITVTELVSGEKYGKDTVRAVVGNDPPNLIGTSFYIFEVDKNGDALQDKEPLEESVASGYLDRRSNKAISLSYEQGGKWLIKHQSPSGAHSMYIDASAAYPLSKFQALATLPIEQAVLELQKMLGMISPVTSIEKSLTSASPAKLIAGHEQAYRSLSKAIAEDERFRELQDKYFWKGDQVGKLWFRLHHEWRNMEKGADGTPILPFYAKEAFGWAKDAIMGLWWETYNQTGNFQKAFDKSEDLQLAQLASHSYRDTVRRNLKIPLTEDGFRSLIGYLKDDLQAKIKRLPEEFQPEAQLGLDLA